MKGDTSKRGLGASAIHALISHPASLPHACVPGEPPARTPNHGGLVRVSVGLEDVDDLVADLDEALAAIR